MIYKELCSFKVFNKIYGILFTFEVYQKILKEKLSFLQDNELTYITGYQDIFYRKKVSCIPINTSIKDMSTYKFYSRIMSLEI